MKLEWLFLLLCAVPAFCQKASACACATTTIVQKVWGNYDVIFWGSITTTGTTMHATVNTPLRGCLQPNQRVPLSVDAACPVTLAAAAIKNGQLFLITGTREGSFVKIDKCGWNRPRARIPDSDALWLSNQFEQCNGRTVCKNNRTPLNCDNSRCNLNACSGSGFCEVNACHNCALQYLTPDKKLKCGELGGHEFESRLCPLCKVDPCVGQTPCKDAPKNVNLTCISNTCFGCDRPIWIDELGRQVCLDKSDSHQCADYGNVIFQQPTCTKPVVLGYANMKSMSCVAVMGCLPAPPDIDLWITPEKCRQECTCVDFTNIDMKFDAVDPLCNQNLGWALVSGKCAIVRGCTAVKSASPVSSSLYATEALCRSACAGKLLQLSVPVVNGRPIDWVEEANGPTAVPQYATVFPRNKVNRMDFKFDPADWAAMQADLKSVMDAYAASAGQSGALGRRLLAEEVEEEEELPDIVKDIIAKAELEDEIIAKSELANDLIEFEDEEDLTGAGHEGRRNLLQWQEDPEEAYLRQRREERRTLPLYTPPTPAPVPNADAEAMNRALAQIFKGDALPDGSCRPLCGSGGSCPPRRNSRAGVSFGFNERGVVLGRDPESFPCTVTSQGFTWHNVGIRFKGGSSLTGAYFMQSKMLPFRIKMDESSKALPQTKGQKFFGFSKLSFSNNWMEKSHIREVLAYEILGASGIKAPRATPVRVYYDIGDGPVFWGLYTMIEDPTDTTVMTFPNDSQPGDGNIYKPENNTWDRFVEIDFEKKNNEKQANFSDVQSAFTALHAPTRLTAPATWRAGLEAVFDVVTFLKVLAAVSIMGNWDTYGLMPHNYYLYNYNGRLTWVPWDFNLALACDDRTTSIFKNEIGDEWPLISFMLADPYYRGVYASFVQWLVTSGPFVAKDLIKRKNQLFTLVTPHVMGLPGVYEAELPPHTVMFDAPSFPQESQKLEVYINQRVLITQRELETEAARLRLGR